jgi:hypothetical protein
MVIFHFPEIEYVIKYSVKLTEVMGFVLTDGFSRKPGEKGRFPLTRSITAGRNRMRPTDTRIYRVYIGMKLS